MATTPTPSPSATSSQTEKSFQDSLRSFEARLTAKERNSFQFATIRDLKRTISQIQATQAAKCEAMHLARLQTFLEGVTQIGKVVEVFANSSQYVAFVWGPMKFLLQVTCNFADAFDTLLDAYEQMGEAIPLVEQYHELFPGNPHLELAVARVYDDILEFHRRAIRFFTLPTWQQVFKSVWKDFNTRFRHILQDLSRHKASIESQSNVLLFQQYQSDRLQVLAEVTRSELAERKRRFLEILQWALAADSSLDHDDVCQAKNEIPGAGTWILRNANYRSWREDSVPPLSILWLNGIPGAGKTVLASTIIENCKSDINAKTIYFYCKHGDPSRATCAAVLGTLLCQLLSHEHNLLPWIYDEYLTSGQLSLTSVELCKRMLTTILRNTEKSFIVIDGLDECEPRERGVLLNVLGDIQRACDDQDPGQTRVLLVSQDEPDIRRGIDLCCEVTLMSTDNEDDIHNFVKIWCGRIGDKFELPEQDKEFMLHRICCQADGMFLFAKLVTKNLFDQINLKKLREEIQPHIFPKGLEQVYDRILGRLSQRPSEEWWMAKTILGWMMCAKRPLRWHEIQGAASLDLEENEVNFEEKRFRVHVREICGSLVTRLSGDRLELVHNTTKHYLERNSLLQPSVIECHLATMCMRYLTFECFEPDLSVKDHRKFLNNGSYALQEYAAVHWSDHLTSVVNNGSEKLSLTLTETENMLGPAITDFVAVYHLLGNDDSESAPNSDQVQCSQFREFDFFDDLSCIFRHLQLQKAKGIAALDEIYPKQLNQVLTSNRELLESTASSTTLSAATRKDLESFYGTSWFRCPKAACFYFHNGFEDGRFREQHMLRHDKPFRCPDETCEGGYKLGFMTKKDLDKHTLVYHPEFGQSSTSFSKLRKPPKKGSEAIDKQSSSKVTKHPAKHKCLTCSRHFTRATILRDHERTHTNDKPFVCGMCDQTFARRNDLNRHSKRHVGGAQFVCKGTRAIPPRDWGCGKVFSRADALANHFKKGAGKACIAPLREEEKLRAKWEARLEGMKHNGSKLPVPKALLQEYPDLENFDWRELLRDDPGAIAISEAAEVVVAAGASESAGPSTRSEGQSTPDHASSATGTGED